MLINLHRIYIQNTQNINGFYESLSYTKLIELDPKILQETMDTSRLVSCRMDDFNTEQVTQLLPSEKRVLCPQNVGEM